jgi:hypothetical protein
MTDNTQDALPLPKPFSYVWPENDRCSFPCHYTPAGPGGPFGPPRADGLKSFPIFTQEQMIEFAEARVAHALAAQPAQQPCRDWKEDASHENGHYQNKCSSCQHYFTGHKRRFTCKVCWDAMSFSVDAQQEPAQQPERLCLTCGKPTSQHKGFECPDDAQPAQEPDAEETKRSMLATADRVIENIPLAEKMAERFCGWKLPDDFAPDCGISFDGRKDDEWNKNKTWPSGTNLLTHEQAKAMFLYCLASVDAQQERDSEPKVETIEIDRQGSCFWHRNCTNHFGGIMKETKREPDKSLIKCLHCGKQGYYPVGGVGRIFAAMAAQGERT